MQIIQPANDPCHRKRMIKKINEAEGVPSFYYALSHLWGLSEKNQYPWDEIGQHVNDEKGKPAESVQMRPEKRDTLLALLKSRPDSYWWIDVLCARTKTPLDIMGDIYSYCFECVAMIDCDPSVIPQLRTMTELRQEIPCLQGESFKSSDFNERLVTKCLQLAEVAKRLMESEWWKRVWTWQEMALPFGDVRFIAETAPHPFQHNTITLNELLYFQKILAVLLKLEPTGMLYSIVAISKQC